MQFTPSLNLRVGMSVAKVRISTTLAKSIKSALNLLCARLERDERV